MSNKRELIMLLNLVAAIAEYDGNNVDDIINHALNYTEAMDDVGFKMDMLMFRLLDEGHTESEVYEMIDNLLPEGIENLSEDQKTIVRNDAKKLLKKREENLNYE